MPRQFFRRISVGYLRKRDYPWYLKPFRALLRHPTFFSVSRRSVAGALWVGLFIALLPLPGQTIVAPLLALLLRVNLPISVVAVWLTNPLTMVPIFWSEYRLGALILDRPVEAISLDISWDWFSSGVAASWQPLLLGAVVSATVVASTAYVLVSVIWRWLVAARYRRRRPPAQR